LLFYAIKLKVKNIKNIKFNKNCPPMKEVKIYSTNYCPFCVRAKKLLESKKIAFTEIDVTGDDDARRNLAEATGRKTVPQIFIGEAPIGGFDDLDALNKQGKLEAMLNS